ncbi:hypothetical protein FIBSPDRAFT_860491 [Athelia psychrophila]|uniref:Uncharacterized protein n=1 Tax=Athelia psychrophila TaxID=1759441 RepID=A0A166K5C8_9AGAM|nr:hypothetical protein FIBSPDRAFT_860491 [Fibularhizoctonia sp. CBS 109695]
MAPNTRASAPNTPTTGSASSPRSSETPSSTPRKVPHCSKCGLPRKGHPRSGCLPSPTAEKAEENMTEALGSLYIDPETSYLTPEKRPRRSSVQPLSVAEASLASISTDSNEVLDALLQPGMMGDDVAEDERAASVERLKSFATPVKGRARMPGTLITPSNTDDSVGLSGLNSFRAPSSSALRASPQETKPRLRHSGPLQLAPTMPADAYLLSSQQTSMASRISSASSHPLVHSMSIEERHDYLNHLTTTACAAPASLFVLQSAEIAGEQRAAHKLGFYSRSVDLANGLGWLIIGMDDKAVQDLYRAIQAAEKGPGGRSMAVMGGAVAGAVITFTGLAYA